MTVPTKSRTRRYLTAISRCVAVVVGTFLIAFFAGSYITSLLPKYYTATAQIQIRGDTPDNNVVTPATLETILAPTVLVPVIERLALSTEWSRFAGDDKTLTSLESIGQLNKMLTLHSLRGTNIVSISVTDDLPKEAADIANAVAERYKALRDSEVQPQTGIPSSSTTQVADEAHSRPLKSLRTLICDSTPRPTNSSVYTIGGTPFTTPPPAPAVMSAPPAPNASFKPAPLRDSPVIIISRAEVPTTPSHPNLAFCSTVTLIGAILLSLVTASFVEVICLFLRAAEGANETNPLPAKP